jgi:hypothetical protein
MLILVFKRGFDVDVLDFEIYVLCKFLAFFGLGNCFGNFFKNGLIIYQSAGHTVICKHVSLTFL